MNLLTNPDLVLLNAVIILLYIYPFLLIIATKTILILCINLLISIYVFFSGKDKYTMCDMTTFLKNRETIQNNIGTSQFLFYYISMKMNVTVK